MNADRKRAHLEKLYGDMLAELNRIEDIISKAGRPDDLRVAVEDDLDDGQIVWLESSVNGWRWLVISHVDDNGGIHMYSGEAYHRNELYINGYVGEDK